MSTLFMWELNKSIYTRILIKVWMFMQTCEIILEMCLHNYILILNDKIIWQILDIFLIIMLHINASNDHCWFMLGIKCVIIETILIEPVNRLCMLECFDIIWVPYHDCPLTHLSLVTYHDQSAQPVGKWINACTLKSLSWLLCLTWLSLNPR